MTLSARWLASVFALMLLPGAAVAQRADRATPGYVRVKLVTSRGAIILAIDTRRAPLTAANFLTYVDDGRLDGTTFFRAARQKGAPKRGFVEGGIGNDIRRSLTPIILEPTSKTHLHHVDGAISMARTTPDSATGNFSILVGASPGMDARPGNPGYAVFGRVADGMTTVKAILAEASAGGSGVMKGQMIVKPVQIVHAIRLDGAAHPSGRAKAWLINIGH